MEFDCFLTRCTRKLSSSEGEASMSVVVMADKTNKLVLPHWLASMAPKTKLQVGACECRPASRNAVIT